MRPFQVAILVVSDTCHRDSSQDRSGPKLKELFASDQKTWTVATQAICPDETEDIRRIVKQWTDEESYQLIITSGGTGFAPRDITPEAVGPLIGKHAWGLQHAMYNKSFSVTPMASMSRLLAGVRRQSLIICVPGSPKGAVENVEAVLQQLPHALDLIIGKDSRQLHSDKKLHIPSSTGTIGHTCAHHSDHHDRQHHNAELRSNDTTQSVTRRARESPYPMIDVSKALDIIVQHSPRLGTTTLSIHDRALIGSIVAKNYTAPESVPAYRASIVDGYAVKSADGPGTYPVVSISHAAVSRKQVCEAGQIVRITTGAPLPDGADSVVMVEDTKLIESTDDNKEEKTVEILIKAVQDDNIREPGSDVKLGELIISKGEKISGGGEIGLLASVGIHEVEVYRKPLVGVLSTGDELVEPHAKQVLENGQIRDSNRSSLLAAIRACNYEAIDLGIAKDQSGDLLSVLKSALDKVNVIITTGGVSMGEKDLLKPSIERALHGTIHFGRVAMKPGKPTTFASIPAQGEAEKLIFALPGNPASALVTFHLFVLPSLRVMSGYQKPNLPRIKVKLLETVRLDPRPEYHRVNIACSEEGILVARSTGMQRSSRVGSLRCNGLLCLPAKTEDCGQLDAGSLVGAFMIDAIHDDI